MFDNTLVVGLVLVGVFAGWMFFTSVRNFVVGGLVSCAAGWLLYSEMGKAEPSGIVIYFMGAIIAGWLLGAVLRYYFTSEDEEMSTQDAD